MATEKTVSEISTLKAALAKAEKVLTDLAEKRSKAKAEVKEIQTRLTAAMDAAKLAELQARLTDAGINSSEDFKALLEAAKRGGFAKKPAPAAEAKPATSTAPAAAPAKPTLSAPTR